MRLIWLFIIALTPLQVMSQEAERIYTVGFAQDTMSNDWRAAQVNEMKAALANYPFIRFRSTDAEGKGFRQAMDLQTLDREGADILVTSPRDQRAMTPVVAGLNKHKPVILLTRKTMDEAFTAFAGADDYKIAQQAAKLIAERLKGRGQVVMLKGVATATTAIAREKGFLDEMNNYPQIEIVASPVANYRRHEAIMAMDKILKQGIAFDAIYAHSDSMASGARLAMESAGIKPEEKVIVGIDYIPEARQAIREGKQTASFTYPTAGREGAELVLQLIRGDEVPKYTEVPSIKVTRENVESVPTIFE